MEQRYSKKEKIAGVFVVSTVFLLLITFVLLGRGKDWFKKHINYYTTFSESYNLQEDADVKLLETKIGKVKNISLSGDRVRVELVILEDYALRITAGAIATVKSPTLIGSEYVSIKPGKNKNALLIPHGGLIPSSPKRSLTDLLEEFRVEETAKMLVAAIKDFSELVQVIRTPDGPLFRILGDINKTTAHIERITYDLQAGKGSAGALLKSSALINRVHANLNTAGAILDHVAEATATLPRKTEQVDNILDHIHSASSKAPETINMMQENLVTIKTAGEGIVESISRIKTILQDVEENLSAIKVVLANTEQASFDIPEITSSSIEGINEIRDSVDDINTVIKSLQKNFLIRPNLPPEPVGKNTDAGLRR